MINNTIVALDVHERVVIIEHQIKVLHPQGVRLIAQSCKCPRHTANPCVPTAPAPPPTLSVCGGNPSPPLHG